jgi:hypothetical protein
LAQLLTDTRGREVKILGRDHTTGNWMCMATCFSCPRQAMVSVDPLGGDFAFYACPSCCEKYLKSEDRIPMQVFAQRLVEAQLEENNNRILTPEQCIILLDDPESWLSKIARDRPGRVV